jgi:ribose transport system ATP-binding protein
MSENAITMHGIEKSFNGIPVLERVDFELRRGEVHALMGGNGAGKSTLMKILEGVYRLDQGSVEVSGQPVQIHSSNDAKRHGIAMIFQEFSLVPTLTVAQNIFLTREPRSSAGFLDDREAERQAQTIFADMGVSIDPRAMVGDLSTGAWQLTEIAKALSKKARILIMDEPTASLTNTETSALFELVGRLKAQGISIIYISHRMEEIFKVADRVTVMRDGRNVITEDTSKLKMEHLIEHIVGRKLEQAFAWVPRQVRRTGTPLLEVAHLASGVRVRDVSFTVYPGEIVGLAGLMGSGRTETARTLFGMDRMTRGEVRVRGKPVRIRGAQDAIGAGISLIPEDRRAQGLVLDHSVKDNLVLPLLHLMTRQGFVDETEGNRLTQSFVEKLSIKTDSIFKQVRLLSGGNQQKVVIAKWLGNDPDILVMDEPTAGVDIGAKTEIVGMIRELANAGKGIVVISSELPELLAVSDRIVVLKDGVVDRELERREIESEEQLHHILQGAKA